jgi:hypothetical protein
MVMLHHNYMKVGFPKLPQFFLLRLIKMQLKMSFYNFSEKRNNLLERPFYFETQCCNQFLGGKSLVGMCFGCKE